MIYDYSVCGEYADVVHALALVESNENASVSGDNGQAWGPLQMHPAAFLEYYGWAAFALDDTWIIAQLKACAAFMAHYGSYPLDMRIQAWNRGPTAVFKNGVRAPDYLQRFDAALNHVRGEHGRQH